MMQCGMSPLVSQAWSCGGAFQSKIDNFGLLHNGRACMAAVEVTHFHSVKFQIF